MNDPRGSPRKDQTKRTTSSVSGKHLQVLNHNRPDSPDRGQLLLPGKPPPRLRRARGSRETDPPTLQDPLARPSPTNQIPGHVLVQLVQHRHYMEGEELRVAKRGARGEGRVRAVRLGPRGLVQKRRAVPPRCPTACATTCAC